MKYYDLPPIFSIYLTIFIPVCKQSLCEQLSVVYIISIVFYGSGSFIQTKIKNHITLRDNSIPIQSITQLPLDVG